MQPTNINFQIPASWADLTDKQLRYVYELIAAEFDTNDKSCQREQSQACLSYAECSRFSCEEIKILCLLHWSKTKLVGRQPSGAYLLKKDKSFFEVTPTMLAEILPNLEWIGNVSPFPVRLSKINRRKALPADFQEVPLETFIVCDNLYQGYLQTQNEGLLDEMALALYPSKYQSPILNKLTSADRVSIFFWIISLKEFFANRFPNFFQPASQQEDGGNLLGSPQKSPAQKLQESMDSMIRALTKGDITKEKQILSLDTWRALTELDAQAREYQELKAQSNAKK